MKATHSLAKQIIKDNNSINTGIFISILADLYLKTYKLTKEEFFKSLDNSLNILKENK